MDDIKECEWCYEPLSKDCLTIKTDKIELKMRATTMYFYGESHYCNNQCFASAIHHGLWEDH